jgi:hypothetical protein
MNINRLLQSGVRYAGASLRQSLRASSDRTVPRGTRFLSLDPEADGPRVPVYSLRDPRHRGAIVRALAAGQAAAFYLGLFTIIKALRPLEEGGDTGDLFWQVKPDRPRWSKLPLIIRPEDALPLIDFDLVHPDLWRLSLRDHFAGLWGSHGAPLHIIAPLRRPLPDLHPAFQTLPEDLREQAAAEAGAADRLLPCATASFFWMPDPAWDDLVDLLYRFSPPRTFLGGTSFNDHAQHPPYTYDELVAHVCRRGTFDVDLVITDELFEQAGVFSSHTMVRLPLVGESPELVVVRHGSITPERLAAGTGYPVRVLGSVKAASRRPGLSDEELEARLRRFHVWRTAA